MNDNNKFSEEYTGSQATNTILAGSNLIKKISSSILGPKGSLKLMTHPDGKITVSNDGATVLKNLLVDHAVSRMIIDTSISQDWEEGDGTTSVAVLTSILVEKAKEKIYGDSNTTNNLLKKVENTNLNVLPIDIIKGFEKAYLKCMDVLEKNYIKVTEKDLEILAMTTLNSKITGVDSLRFSKMCVGAVKLVSCGCHFYQNDSKIYGESGKNYYECSKNNTEKKDNEKQKLNKKLNNESCTCEIEESVDLNMIKIIKKIGPISNSFISPGLIIENKNTLEQKKHPKILATNTNLDNVKVKLALTKIEIERMQDMVEIEEKEINRIKEKVDRMCKKKFDFLINRQIVYDTPAKMFMDKNVQVIENVGFDNIERIGQLTNTKIVSTFGENNESIFLNDHKLGKCHEIKSIKIGSEKYAQIVPCNQTCEEYDDKHYKKSCTIVLFASSETGLDELERSVHDALCVVSNSLKEKKVVYGGGNVELLMAIELFKMASEMNNSEAVAIKIFAESLLEIPKILAKNSGGNGDEIVEKLLHLRKRNQTCGVNLDVNSNTIKNDKLSSENFIGCMKKSNIYDSLRVKQRIISAATECAQMIVKCDTIIKHQPRQRDRL